MIDEGGQAMPDGIPLNEWNGSRAIQDAIETQAKITDAQFSRSHRLAIAALCVAIAGVVVGMVGLVIGIVG